MTTKERAQPSVPPSAKMLEYQFFKAFFARLAREGELSLALGGSDIDARFHDAYRALLETPGRTPLLRRLLDALRPDPITGSATALHENLLRLQPGVVTIPNFQYRHASLFDDDSGAVEALIDCFGESFPSMLDRAVDAFLSGSSNRVTDADLRDGQPDTPPPS